MQRFVAGPNEGRLDIFLARRADVSRSRVQALVRQGAITVNGRPVRPGYRLEEGDVIEAELLPPPAPSLEPQQIPLRVVYEDADLLVIDKPAGLTVHPAPGHPSGTLVNAILGLGTTLSPGEAMRPGIVHRLDKDTSGLMVVAKNERAHQRLARQFVHRGVRKEYLALLEGRLRPEHGAIDAPIGRDSRFRQRMAVSEQGRPARTGYRVLEYLDGYTLVLASLETGRTHQIRVHFAAIGHPVVGDPVYGHTAIRGPKAQRNGGTAEQRSRGAALGAEVPRQFLHAHILGFDHPADGRRLEFESELPKDLQDALASVRRGR